MLGLVWGLARPLDTVGMWGPAQAMKSPSKVAGLGVACGMGGIPVRLRIDAQVAFVVEPGTGDCAKALAAFATAGDSMMTFSDAPCVKGAFEAMG